MGYYEIMRGLQNIFNTRLQMVRLAQEKGISEAARLYKTTRNTVGKWLNRYLKEVLSGLKDRSRAPNYFFRKSPKEIEERIVELRKTHPAWGSERLDCIMAYPVLQRQ